MGRGPGQDAVKRASALIAAMAALAALAGAARADFQICNRMSYVVETAVGLQEAGALELLHQYPAIEPVGVARDLHHRRAGWHESATGSRRGALILKLP